MCIVLIFSNGGVSGEPIALLGAFDTELELIRTEISAPDTHIIMGIRFCSGTIRGKQVVVTEAGVAKVNAAVTTALLIEHFNPSAVIFSGIAGALGDSVFPGDIVIGLTTAHHDLVSITDEVREHFGVVNPVTGERNPVFFPADERLISVARDAAREIAFTSMETTVGERIPRVIEGIIATGDAFVASEELRSGIRTDLNANAVEMEGAAVAQVCYQYDIPCIIIRSISDNADANAAIDFECFYRIAARNSAEFVIKMVELLE